MEDLALQKQTDTEYKVHPLIEQRWSPRAFSGRPVESYKIKQLFEAARWAPSCYNEQPWQFIVASRDQHNAYDNILDCLVEFNQDWAQTAPVLMITIVRNSFSQNGKTNDYACYDLGQAMANLSLQATKLDLHLHQMAGFDKEKAREHFDIPDGHEAVSAVALGYLGDPEKLNETLAAKESAPRSRKSIHDFVFTDRWGEESNLLDS